MKNLALTLLALFITQLLIFAQQQAKTTDGKTVLLYEDGSWMYADNIPLHKVRATTISKLEIPATNYKDIIITHAGYALSYNETYEQANWVAYDLTKTETNKLFDRTDKFISDPKVETGTANDNDYSHSGYDRGHLAPASDMGWSSTTMSESFYYSNMSPQLPGFNRGIWKKLEELVRSWATAYDTIYIATGPVLTGGLPSIGSNKVSVPNFFYKVILDDHGPARKGIGFIIPNEGSTEPLQHYAVSIDSVEKITGINFFPLLPDASENTIEKTLCLPCWSWKNFKATGGAGIEKIVGSVQCSGVTKAGARCKNKTTDANGYCHLHQGQTITSDENFKTAPEDEPNNVIQKSATAVQCSGTTNVGNRCKRRTKNSTGRCFQHQVIHSISDTVNCKF